MTTLYRPVKITTVEQAAQMPNGSMAYCDALDAYGNPCRSVAGKHRGAWWSDDRQIPVTGWTALMPVEAEEELVEKRRLCQKDPDVLHRYVTGWQHYTAKEQNR